MKTNEEFYNSVIEKKNNEIKKRKHRAEIIVGFAIVIAIAAVITVPKLNIKAEESVQSYDTQNSVAATAEISDENGEEIISENSSTALTEEISPENYFDEKSVTSAHNTFLTAGCFPLGEMNGEIVESGEILTDAEVREYIISHKEEIVTPLAFEKSIGSGEFEICLKGYGHVSIQPDMKKELPRNNITVPILKNGKIIGKTTLVKTDGKITDYPEWGGDSFEMLNGIFNENPSSELVFAYDAGIPEVIVTPDNNLYFNPSAVKYKRNFDYYSALKTPYNTFSKDDLKNTVTVDM